MIWYFSVLKEQNHCNVTPYLLVISDDSLSLTFINYIDRPSFGSCVQTSDVIVIITAIAVNPITEVYPEE